MAENGRKWSKIDFRGYLVGNGFSRIFRLFPTTNATVVSVTQPLRLRLRFRLRFRLAYDVTGALIRDHIVDNHW